MEIEDDGVGLSSGAGEGMGLKFMRQRARLIGAALDLRPREGGGTVVSCTVPRDA
jgi:two-component system CheB/CheR fusion protein